VEGVLQRAEAREQGCRCLLQHLAIGRVLDPGTACAQTDLLVRIDRHQLEMRHRFVDHQRLAPVDAARPLSS
jgi:hypothetical protein